MTRNVDFRVEVLCPVRDTAAQETLQHILDQQWYDNVKGRVLDADQENRYAKPKKKAANIRSQESIHRYLSTGKVPRHPKTKMRRPSVRRKRQ